LTQCHYCPAGSYALKSTSTVCEDCPNNADCEGGNVINVNKGYWRVNNFSAEILKCKGTSSEACLGGTNGGDTCTEGNYGPYCAVCYDHYLPTIDGTCKYCSGKSTSSFGFILVIIILGIIFLFFLLAYFYRRRFITVFETTYHSVMETLESQSSKIKIMFAFTQILSQFPSVLSTPRVPYYSTLMGYYGVLSFNLLSYFQIQCDFEYTFYDKLVFVTIVPIIIAPFIFIYYYSKSFFSYIRNSSNPDFSYWDAKRQSTYYFLVLIFAVFAPASTTILQSFVCEKFDDGSSYMYSDYRLDCKTDEHQKYVAYAAVMVVIYPVGIPLFYFYLLWTNLNAINPPTKRVVKDAERHIVSPEIIQLEKLNLRSNDESISHLSFLFESYRPGAWYFEVVECLRRLFLTALPSLILPGSAVQTIIVLIFSMIFSFAYAELKPFVVHSDSIAAIAAEWGLTLTLLMGLMLTISQYEDSLPPAVQNLVGLIMIGLNVGIVIFTVYVSVFNQDDKQKNALDKFKSTRTRKRSSTNRSSTPPTVKKRNTNETLPNRVRVSWKRMSGSNPEPTRETSMIGVEMATKEETTISPLNLQNLTSRLKKSHHDSDDESDSDDSATDDPQSNYETKKGVIVANSHDSMTL
jgi:hypothetical protein